VIYITGDIHGDLEIHKFTTKNFPRQKELTKQDYVIIAGDFGCLWAGDNRDKFWLNWLESKNFTTLWIDGNHENFALINQYPVKEWNGGKVHFIRPSVIHLMRGQVFIINGRKFFTFGGAMSTDIAYRKKDVSWWTEEIPNEAEFQEGMQNLKQHNMSVDYVITHTAPNNIIQQLDLDFNGERIKDPTSQKLHYFMENVRFKQWYFGHFHTDKSINNFTAIYDKIEVLK
jgi:hypothetical protein